MFAVSAAAIILTMTMALVRGLRGPTVYDRALAVNMFGTATVLLIAVLGFLTGRPDFLDLSILYTLLSFMGTIALLKFVRYRDLGRTHQDGEDPPEDQWTW